MPSAYPILVAAAEAAAAAAIAAAAALAIKAGEALGNTINEARNWREQAARDAAARRAAENEAIREQRMEEALDPPNRSAKDYPKNTNARDALDDLTATQEGQAKGGVEQVRSGRKSQDRAQQQREEVPSPDPQNPGGLPPGPGTKNPRCP
jgi:hypothetical protein